MANLLNSCGAKGVCDPKNKYFCFLALPAMAAMMKTRKNYSVKIKKAS